MLQSTKIGMATRNGKSLTRCCYYSLACHILDFSVIIYSLYHPILVIAFSLIVLDFLYILDTPTTSDYTNYTTPNIKGLSTQTPFHTVLLQSCRSIRYRYAFRNRTASLLFPFSIAYPKIKYIQNRFIFSLKV